MLLVNQDEYINLRDGRSDPTYLPAYLPTCLPAKSNTTLEAQLEAKNTGWVEPGLGWNSTALTLPAYLGLWLRVSTFASVSPRLKRRDPASISAQGHAARPCIHETTKAWRVY